AEQAAFLLSLIVGLTVFVLLTGFQQVFGASLYRDGVDHLNTLVSSYQWSTGALKSAKPDYASLKEKLQRYLETRPGQWSVYVQDLSTGQTLDMGADQVYDAASTIKMPLVLYLYELAAQGKVDLNTRLTYTPQYYEQGSGIIQGQPFGSQYSLQELARLAIENSDNVAWHMIQDYLGRDNFIAFMKSLGGEATGMVNGYSVTTPRDMGEYLKALLAFRAEHPAPGNEILDYMEHSVYDPKRYSPGTTGRDGGGP
ncbi:MAG: class A beta-lactamase-related serine hydrolase, partial [Firmicutes bacterium]|nr:class A beta-lactamase-related serine hydrolase [Bacillota bacterium]